MGGLFKILQAIFRFLPSLGRQFQMLREWLLLRGWGKWLVFFLAGSVGAVIERVIFFLGISFVAYTWATPALVEYVAAPLLGLPSTWQSFLAMTRIDDAVTVILSAIVYKIANSISIRRNTSSPFANV